MIPWPRHWESRSFCVSPSSQIHSCCRVQALHRGPLCLTPVTQLRTEVSATKASHTTLVLGNQLQTKLNVHILFRRKFPFVWTQNKTRRQLPWRVHRRAGINEAAEGTDLNFPVRTCRALIPHCWAPPTSPTMSSPIMRACQ